MTRETTDRIGASFFEALNKDGMVDKSITPVNKMDKQCCKKVSSLNEGAPEIVTFPMAGQGGIVNATSDGSGGESTNNVPNIGFNDNNIHTLYASSKCTGILTPVSLQSRRNSLFKSSISIKSIGDSEVQNFLKV